jgi:hypothetical protein
LLQIQLADAEVTDIELTVKMLLYRALFGSDLVRPGTGGWDIPAFSEFQAVDRRFKFDH